MKPFSYFLSAWIALAFSWGTATQAWAVLTVTNPDDSGAGSLRAAIEQANTTSLADIIAFAAGVTGTINLTSGELTITQPLRIVGPGAAMLAVSGSFHRRVFNIAPGVTVDISDITIKDGKVRGTDGVIVEENQGQTGPGSPGGDASGGGILNQGTLTLTRCTISNCRTEGGNAGWDQNLLYSAGAASGGGIANQGTLNLTGCTLVGNLSTGGEGAGGFNHNGGVGGAARAAGIANQGALDALNCTFQNNTATGGLGGFTNSDISSNQYTGGTGGVANGGAIWSQASVTLTRCTSNGNKAIGGRGGRTIVLIGYSFNLKAGTGGNGMGGAIESHSPASMTNCTLSGNSADGGAPGVAVPNTQPGIGGNGTGGALANHGTLTLRCCNVSGNSGSGLYQSDLMGSTNVHNTIIANNGVPGDIWPDVFGDVNSQGYNLIRITDGSSGWIGSDLTGDSIFPLEAGLGPLQDRGGLTLTMVPLLGSPALNAGDDSVLNPPLNLATDQRGSPRKTGAQVDIGACEAGSIVVMNTNNSGPGSLRQAVLAAQTNDIITFANGVSGTIVLTSGQIMVSTSQAIFGPTAGVEVSGNVQSRVFRIASGVTTSISKLTISDGYTTGQSGMAAMGGGVLNEGTLTLTNCTLRDSLAFGAIGTSGLGGGAANLGTLILDNCTLAGNHAIGGSDAGSGGALFNQGTLTVRSCTISRNFATAGQTGPGSGGGLFQSNGMGSTSVRSTIIEGNTVATSSPDVAGIFTSAGHNLIGITSGSFGFGFTGDLLNSPASLGPLQNNGGPTPTMALVGSSAAIDKGSSTGLLTDQRGGIRFQDFPAISNGAGDGSDIGAFEKQLPVVDIGLRVRDGIDIVRIAAEPIGSLISPLRIWKNGITYGIVLTDINSPDASRMRVQTSSGIKALQKLP